MYPITIWMQIFTWENAGGYRLISHHNLFYFILKYIVEAYKLVALIFATLTIFQNEAPTANESVHGIVVVAILWSNRRNLTL